MEPVSSIQETNRRQVGEFKVYKRRWYIVILFGMYAWMQSLIWNTWGPISSTSMNAFGWQTSTIAWMNNWGMVSFVATGFLFMWLLQVKGLRWATLTSMLCVAFGSAFRVITSDSKIATVLIHIGQFVNGVGGPISSGAIPVLSATWFPPDERVIATAIANSLNVFGTAVAYILGPALVSDIYQNRSLSLFPNKILLFQYSDEILPVADVDNVTHANIHKEKNEIMRYMYYECGWAVFLLLVITCYFPSKPHCPPSMSAAVQKQPFWSGLIGLRRKGYFQLLNMIFGVSTGVFGGWASVLNINLSVLNVGQETAGWIGFYSLLAGCVCSLLVGRFASYFVQYIRFFILTLYIIATAALVIFYLMCINVIPCNIVGLYVTVIVATAAINAAIPLLYELSCELAYPISEGSANAVLTLFGNFWGLLFLAVFSIPNIGTMWMNQVVIASTGGCIFLIVLLKGRLNRLEVDEGVHPENYIEDVVIVPEQFRDDDPLLAYGEAPSESNTKILDVSSIYCGIQNPTLTDTTVPSNTAADICFTNGETQGLIDSAVPSDIETEVLIPNQIKL